MGTSAKSKAASAPAKPPTAPAASPAPSAASTVMGAAVAAVLAAVLIGAVLGSSERDGHHTRMASTASHQSYGGPEMKMEMGAAELASSAAYAAPPDAMLMDNGGSEPRRQKRAAMPQPRSANAEPMVMMDEGMPEEMAMEMDGDAMYVHTEEAGADDYSGGSGSTGSERAPRPAMAKGAAGC